MRRFPGLHPENESESYVTKAELKRMAYREAAAIVANCDGDLDETLTPDEEEFVREFMQKEIVKQLRAKGKETA